MKTFKYKILKKFLLLTIAGGIIFQFGFNTSAGDTQNIFKKGDTTFLIGVQTGGYNSLNGNIHDPYVWDKQLPFIKNTLLMNAATFFAESNDADFKGTLQGNVMNYGKHVKDFSDAMNENGIIGTYTRPPLRDLAWGQRSTYEAEDNERYGFKNDILPTGENFTGDNFGVSGRKAVKGRHQAGFLISHLIENWEQSDNAIYCGAGPHDEGPWFVKPRLRIDPGVIASNPLVARVVIYNIEGDSIKSVNLYAKNFLDPAGKYDGSYIEEFKGADLSISGDLNSLNKGFNNALTLDVAYHFKEEDMKLDYRIWWYGSCDLWVDYVRVDDVFANDLFKGKYNTKIEDETREFADKGYHFYIDEFRYNNIPCIKYVSDKIRQVNPEASIIGMTLADLNVSLKHKLTDTKAYIDSVHPAFLMSDLYPLSTSGAEDEVNEKHRCWLPPGVNPLYRQDLMYLKNSDYDKYTEMMQNEKLGDKSRNWDATINLFDISFIAGMNRFSKDAQSKGIRHVPVIQTHGWLLRDNDKVNTGSLREPTTEEIRVLVNLALCYGAKGIQYFIYGSGEKPYLTTPQSYPPSKGSSYTFLGLTYLENNAPGIYAKPVPYNYYGQDKIKEIRDIDIKLNAWGPLLMKLNWQDGYSIHKEGAAHNYISDIKSYYRKTNQEFNGEDAVKYWEAGFFNPVDANDKAKYFMMVNRRTVPDINGAGGDIRKLYVKFNSAELPDYTNWKITDAATGEAVLILNKNSGTYEYMGLFQPGEGKLYKIEPVN